MMPMRCCTPTVHVEDGLHTPTLLSANCGKYGTSPSLHCAYAVLLTSLFPEFVCGYLSASDILNVSLVSRTFHRAVQQPQVWKALLACHFRFSDVDLMALDRMSAGTSTFGGSNATSINSLYLRAHQASSFVLRPGCTIDPLMLAAGVPRLARVLHGAPTSSTGRKPLPSPDRCMSAFGGGLTSSQGVTPTPSRHRPWSTTAGNHVGRLARLEVATPTSVPGDDDHDVTEFHLCATISDLVAGAGTAGRVAAGTHELRATPEASHFVDDDAWSVRWSNEPLTHLDHLPPLHYTSHEYLFHMEQGAGVPVANNASTLCDGMMLEPLVRSSACDDEDEGGALYASGALVLGSECHHRFSEIWESQEAARQPTVDTTVLHIPMEPLECSDPIYDDGMRSSSLMSNWFGGVSGTPVPRQLTSPPVASWDAEDSVRLTCNPEDSSSTNCAMVLASVVCAETLVSSLRCGADAYPFQKLFAHVHRHRVKTFLDATSRSRKAALAAVAEQSYEEALQRFNISIESMMEGGCASSAANNYREALVSELVLRGRLLRTLKRDEQALGDFAMAYTLDNGCHEAYTESTVIITSPERCVTHAARILSPSFSMHAVYDEMLVAGKSITERAAFLFEVLFWRGPSMMLHVYQYLICDIVGYRPVRLLLNAEELAESPSERLTVKAWILHDNGNVEQARSTAELSVSLISHDMARFVAETEHRCTELTKRLLGTHNIEQLLSVHAPMAAFRSVQKLAAIREAMQALNDIDLAATLAVAHVDEMHVFQQALYSRDGEVGDFLRDGDCAVFGSAPSQVTSVTASFSYFTLAYLNGDSDISIDAYRRHMFSHSQPSRAGGAFNNLGFIVLKRRGPALALPLFEAARAIYPTHFKTLKNLARCYTQLGMLEDAYHALTAVADCGAFCGPRAEVLYDRSCLTRSNLADLNRATELNPRFSNPYKLRAALCMDRGDAQAAIEELNKVISLTMNAEDVSLRALFRRDAGDRAGAMRDMALAVTLMPTNKEYRNALRELVMDDARRTWVPRADSHGDVGDELFALHQDHHSAPATTPATPTDPADMQHDRFQNAVIDEETDRLVVSAVSQWIDS
jgi:tetratricopeptide (TPR) repeat protein